MANTMVYSNHWNFEQKWKSSCDYCTYVQRRAHPWPFCICDKGWMEIIIPISWRREMLAYDSACLIKGIISFAWCYAVSLGKKPVPGGVTKVFRGLDTMFPWKSTMPLFYLKYLFLLYWHYLLCRAHIFLATPLIKKNILSQSEVKWEDNIFVNLKISIFCFLSCLL